MLKVIILGWFLGGLLGELCACSSQTSNYVPAPSKTILKTEVVPLFPYPRNESELNAYRVTFLPTFEIYRRLYVHRFTDGKWDSLVGVLDPGMRAMEDVHAEAGSPYEYRVTELPAKESMPLQVMVVSIDRGIIVHEDSVTEVASLPRRAISRILLQKNSKLLTRGLSRDLVVGELIADVGATIKVGDLPKEDFNLSKSKTGPFRLISKRVRGTLIVSPEFNREKKLSGDRRSFRPDVPFGTQEMEFVIEDNRELNFKYTIDPTPVSTAGPDEWEIKLFATFSRRFLLDLNHEKWIVVGPGQQKRLSDVTGFYRVAENQTSNEGIYVPASGKGPVKIIFESDTKKWITELLGLPLSSLGEARSPADQELKFPKMVPNSDYDLEAPPSVPFGGTDSSPIFRRLNPESKFTLAQMRRLVLLHDEVGQLIKKLEPEKLSVEFLLPEKPFSGFMEITKEHQTLLEAWVRDPNRLINFLKQKKANRLEIRIQSDSGEHAGAVQWVISEPIPAELR